MKSALRLIAIILLFLALPPEVRADYRQFIPRISKYEAFLTVDSSYDKQEDTTNGRGTKSKDFFLRERLQLASVGYVFDPRFITFVIKLSGGLKHESYSVNNLSESLRTMYASEYTFRMIVLPDHPYNLELFALRVEPLTKRVFQEAESIAYTKGAIFRYKKKPYFFNAHYIDNTSESPVGSYTTRKYGAIGTYFKELGQEKVYSYSGSYDHTTSSFTSGGATDTAALANTYFLKTMSFSSNLGYQRSSQGAGPYTLSLKNTSINWGEHAGFKLPWNFTSDLGFQWNNNKLETYGVNLAKQKFSATTRNFTVQISHQLYQSLYSHVSAAYGSLSSSTGSSKTLSTGAGVSYVKNIPWGRLRSNIYYSRNDEDRTGPMSVPNEIHSGVNMPGIIMLNNPGADISTLLVFVRSPFFSNDFILLTPNVNYIVEPFGNTFRLLIFNLPPQFATPGTYDFLLSYTLNNAESKLRTTNLNYSINFELFKGSLFPSYNHNASRQKIVSGVIDQVPWNFTTDIFGLTYVKTPFTFSATYTNVKSDISPSKEWKADVTYVDDIGENTSMQAAANFSNTHYPEGTGPGGVSYTDRLFGASASIRRMFLKRNMSAAISGSYSREKALATSNSYSLDSSFVWTAGKIHVMAGATLWLSNSEYQGVRNRRTEEYYYLNVRRKLF